MVYTGAPVLLEDLLYRPAHSLIDQSLHSRLGAETTNGDGFGVGWYGRGEEPALFRSIEPAWNDRNLRELSKQITSPLVFAHIRASSGGAIQQTNCHPFRHENWLWMHNGLIHDFGRLKRDLVLQIDPEYYPSIEGSTDSEVFFHLALTFGLQHDAPNCGGARRRSRRASRRSPRRAAPGADDRGDDRWNDYLGLPVRVRRRGPAAVAVLQHRRHRTA
jgi:glutamine amidotransferase